MSKVILKFRIVNRVIQDSFDYFSEDSQVLTGSMFMLLQMERQTFLSSGMKTRDKVRQAIREAGYQQKDFAKMMNVTTSTLSDLLTGKRDFNISRLTKAAKLLGKSLDDFQDDDDPKPRVAETVPVPGPLGQSVQLTLDEFMLVKLARARNVSFEDILRVIESRSEESGIITSHNSQRGKDSKSG